VRYTKIKLTETNNVASVLRERKKEIMNKQTKIKL